MENGKTPLDTSSQKKITALFKYLAELTRLTYKDILDIRNYEWHYSLKSIPNRKEYVSGRFFNDVDTEEQQDDAVLTVKKPEFTSCEMPDSSFSEWLVGGWDDYKKQPTVKKEMVVTPKINFANAHATSAHKSSVANKIGQSRTELFDDNKKRVEDFQNWFDRREKWVRDQKERELIKGLFNKLYQIASDLERDAETNELIVADGFLSKKDMPQLNHPIITRRVGIRYDADRDMIYIEDVDVDTELYTAIFQDIQGINTLALKDAREQLRSEDYHPFDKVDLPDFFKRFLNKLTAQNIYIGEDDINAYEGSYALKLYRNPCLILRKRSNGTIKAIERILEHVDETNDIPKPLLEIIGGSSLEPPSVLVDQSIEEQLASVGGESVNILLAKEANREQLEIARRVEQYNAVLVQGPPGTGKTHTIANLIGHFLAQGKSILVTSYTRKALRVLKEKVPQGMQNLCVSILDDSHTDMEKSVDGITDYLSTHDLYELKKQIDDIRIERDEVIAELAKVRKKIYSIINKEASGIVYDGNSLSLTDVGKFVQEHIHDYGYLPGQVKPYEPFPLTQEELTDLYKSNAEISEQTSREYSLPLPHIDNLLAPRNFEKMCEALLVLEKELGEVARTCNWEVHTQLNYSELSVKTPSCSFCINIPSQGQIDGLKSQVEALQTIESWMQACAIDGKMGGAHASQWEKLITCIQNLVSLTDRVMEATFGKDISIEAETPDFKQELMDALPKVSRKSFLGNLFRGNFSKVLIKGATINGEYLQSAEDIQLILDYLELNSQRRDCESLWNKLVHKNGGVLFADLDQNDPALVAKKYIPYIEYLLGWYTDQYPCLKNSIDAIGIPFDKILQLNQLDSDSKIVEKVFCGLNTVIPAMLSIFEKVLKANEYQAEIEKAAKALQEGKDLGSSICEKLIFALNNRDKDLYAEAFSLLETVRDTKDKFQNRNDYIEKINEVAPDWAQAIRNQDGIHGEPLPPADIRDAWKWKQYYAIIDDLLKEPLSDLQNRSVLLSKKYREATAQYAEKLAWHNLIEKTEQDLRMRQNLNGWKQTVKKIGKGTGKNAPKYKAEARRLMAECQNAVPCWIMPLSKALESLDPAKNTFDVVIIDEASQADITALSVLYMGRKLVIVGDDKQVSPMGIGVDIDEVNRIREVYLGNSIPNAILYDTKTSIYDIAATTFHPLMLHEHFRCAPEIIGFSNGLSYDFKIKPLRDCSDSKLLPAVVQYRSPNGRRSGKTNEGEARTIALLIKACIEQPEYEGKTFGVISMLGSDQVKILQTEIDKYISAVDVKNRHILCGIASDFQGDERDVVFLSLVDCSNESGTVRKQGDRSDDAYKKRYNVAASRARDQLWVVHSLDSSTDLKPGDLRKRLIDYATDPHSFAQKYEEVEAKAESPFETSVASSLVNKGFHIEQQWSVGSYRLDIVVCCGKKKVAIECDGERWHSGEEKIREDMERQTILERLGWTFVRIRGSEYYRDPEATMDRVVKELKSFGIEEEDSQVLGVSSCDTELLERVKLRAHELSKNSQVVSSVSSNPAKEISEQDSATAGAFCPSISDSQKENSRSLSSEERRQRRKEYREANREDASLREDFYVRNLSQKKGSHQYGSRVKANETKDDRVNSATNQERDLVPGQKVITPRYGKGTIIGIDGNKVRIALQNTNKIVVFMAASLMLDD